MCDHQWLQDMIYCTDLEQTHEQWKHKVRNFLFLTFDLIKAKATKTETSLLKQYVAGECVDLLDGKLRNLSSEAGKF